jgi:hypothetical protein
MCLTRSKVQIHRKKRLNIPPQTSRLEEYEPKNRRTAAFRFVCHFKIQKAANPENLRKVGMPHNCLSLSAKSEVYHKLSRKV